MKFYTVIAGPLSVAVGTVMALADDQIAARANNLDTMERRPPFVFVRTKAMLQFKAGEIVGLAEVDKAAAGRVKEIPPDEAKAEIVKRVRASAARHADAKARARAAAGIQEKPSAG